MAFPHSDLGQDMPSLEAENLHDSYLQTLKEGRAQLFRGPFLWERILKASIMSHSMVSNIQASSSELRLMEISRPILCSLSKLCELQLMEILEPFLCSLSKLCEETESQDFYLLSNGFSRVGLEEALICSHKEQSDFQGLSDGAIALCLHVASVVFLNSALLWMRVYASEHNTKYNLSKELGDIYQKWKWGGRCWNRMVNTQWLKFVQLADDHEKEEAMKLLYQWTQYPLQFVYTKVRIRMDGLTRFGDEVSVESERLSKWVDELCRFLEHCRALFKLSNHAEFLYLDLQYLYKRTALLHKSIGDNKVAAQLNEAKLKMVEGIGDSEGNLRWVAKWDWMNCKTTYDKRHPATELRLKKAKKVPLQEAGKERKDLEERGTFAEYGQNDHCNFVVSCDNPQMMNNPQMIDIIDLICRDRFIKARMVLSKMNLKDESLNAEFRDFLHYELDDFPTPTCSSPPFIFHLCGRYDMSSSEIWEFNFRKLDFLLEICDVLGDQQLTAKVYAVYGASLWKRSLEKFGDVLKDAPSLKLLLIEELKLQPNCPAPECIRELLDCLDKPCESNDDHKHANQLPDALKGIRHLRRSISIYSDLVDKFWAQGGSDEAGLLQLLELQQNTYRELLRTHEWISIFCGFALGEELTDGSELLVSKTSVAGSRHSSLVIKKAMDVLNRRTWVWVEKGRAATLQKQLGPWYNTKRHHELDGIERAGSLKEDMIPEFGKDHKAAWSAIMSSRKACKGEPLFVEYESEARIDGLRQGVAYVTSARHRKCFRATLVYDANEMKDWVDAFFKKIVKVRKRVKEGLVESEDVELLDEKKLKRLANLNTILESLYDKLIEPFSRDPMFQHLHSGSTIVFVPDKLLYRVPFALLRDKKTQKHLFQLHPISVSPSLRILERLKARERDLDMCPLKEECILAVGDAAYEPPTESLPGTRAELNHLQSLFGEDRVKTLEKGGATRANFLELVKEASTSEEKHVYAFMHLGVHGRWFNEENEDNEDTGNRYRTGCLQFAKPPHQSGDSVAAEESGLSAPDVDMLPSEDIIRMGVEWRARLVVLSACDSSRGQVCNDGEINLPRALMIAGIPVAVVSQWKICDKTSSRLMEAFYKKLRCGQEVARALQCAMLELSNDQGSKSAIGIFEWGPFLIWGLPTVKLPKDLWTENARKTIRAREQVELLRDKFNNVLEDEAKVQVLEVLPVVETFIEAVSCDTCTIDDKGIARTVLAISSLLQRSMEPFVSDEVVAIAEEFYKVHLPLERVEGVQLGLKELDWGFTPLSIFRKNIIFVHTMKGNYQIALNLANKLVEDCQNTRTGIDEITQTEIVSTYKQERAVILRLIGVKTQSKIQAKRLFDEALKDFEEALKGFEALGEAKMQFFCLIQMSYLKNLLEDESGALACALQAKEMKLDWQRPGEDPFLLCFKALPDEYSRGIFNVRDDDAGLLTSVSHDLTTVHPLNKGLNNPTASLHARHLAVTLKADTDVAYFRKHQKETLQEALIAVETFLTCGPEINTTIRAIIVIEELFSILFSFPHYSERIVQLAEYVYLLAMYSEQLERVEQQLEYISLCLWEQQSSRRFLMNELGIASGVDLDKCEDFSKMFTIIIRKRIMYVQAKCNGGSCQIALEHANKAIEFIQDAMRRNTPNEAIVQALKVQEMTFTRERGVVLRLLGEAQMKLGDEDGAKKTFVEAQDEFDKAQQAFGENYECLIQTSYLKYLMKDGSGQMLAARRAKRLEAISPLDCSGYGAFVLGFKALPEEYREWLLHADASAEPVLSSSVWVSYNANVNPKLCPLSEDILRAQVARLQVALNDLSDADLKARLENYLVTVDSFLSAVCYTCPVDEEVVEAAAAALDQILSTVLPNAISEIVYTFGTECYLILFSVWIARADFDLMCCSTDSGKFHFRSSNYRRSLQALKENHRTALEYTTKIIVAYQNAYEREHDNKMKGFLKMHETIIRHGRVVIYRRMLKYEDAWKEVDELLAHGWNEVLEEAGYLKYLMEDKSAAFEYACVARKLKESNPSTGSFYDFSKWVFNQVPDNGYLQWLESVDEETLTEDARKSLVRKHRSQFLRQRFIEDMQFKIGVLNWLKDFDTFFLSACRTVEEKVAVDAIISLYLLDLALRRRKEFSKMVVELAQDFYSELSSICELTAGIELELKRRAQDFYSALPSTHDSTATIELKLKRGFMCTVLPHFRERMMYMQAMRGNHQIALDYADEMIKNVQEGECVCGRHCSLDLEFLRQERAVVLRLMGRYDEALNEFDDLLAGGEDYEYLTQASYIKHLLQDENGALAYARRAKLQSHNAAVGAFILGSALPEDFRQWLLNTYDENPGPTSSSDLDVTK